jgi:hypothetical protein
MVAIICGFVFVLMILAASGNLTEIWDIVEAAVTRR